MDVKDNEELRVYCDFMNPEDLALTPDGKFLIVAEFGGMAPLVEMTSGKLSFFNLKEKAKISAKITFGNNEWGSDDCFRDQMFHLVLMALIWFKEKMEDFSLQSLVTIPKKA